jgi:GNAT superfamily N-acetyltransferase
MLMQHYVVREAVDTDRAALRQFLTTLSTGTLVNRFGRVLRVTDQTVDDLLGARLPGSVFVAVHGSAIVGHVRWRIAPGWPEAADMGVVVADAWQGRGVGSRLLDAALDEAEVLGVTRLVLSVPVGNQAGRRFVELRWPGSTAVIAEGVSTYDIALTEQILRSAA